MFRRPVGYQRISLVPPSLACFFRFLRASGDNNQRGGFWRPWGRVHYDLPVEVGDWHARIVSASFASFPRLT